MLSEAGKPIFASCGHEEQLCSLMALVQTFVMVVASWGDCLMRIRSSDLHICFSHRNPLILCVVSRDEFQLNAQVDLVYKQVIICYPYFCVASPFDAETREWQLFYEILTPFLCCPFRAFIEELYVKKGDCKLR